jgi:hypothetical protein
MKNYLKPVLFFALIAMMLLGILGCSPTSPYPESMWTMDIYPGITNTYNVGSPTYTYANGYFTNLFVAGLPVGDNVTGAGTAGRLVQWAGVSSIMNATNTDAQVAAAVGNSHVQNTDITLTTNGVIHLIDAGLLENDLHTDRWLLNTSNTFLGVNVAGAGTLTHTALNEGYENTVIGETATHDITTGYSNTAIGYRAGNKITTGYDNTAIGADAMVNVTTQDTNTALGHQALMNVAGGKNTSIGNGSMGTATGSWNTAVGMQTLISSDGDENTAVGVWAGQNNDGDSNVFLGYRAGENNVGDDKLYIDNSNDATPLIYGDFSTDTVTINDNLNVTNCLDLTGSNITYVPLTGDIQTYVNNAVAGDTLILASGQYTITADITISKQLNIVGQGNAGFLTSPVTASHGTLITSVVNGITAFQLNYDNICISDMSINLQGAGSRGINTAKNLTGLVFNNIDVIVNSKGVNTGFYIYNSNVVMRDLTFYITSTDSVAAGVYIYNDNTATQDNIVDCFSVTGTAKGAATTAYAFACFNNNTTHTLTLNLAISVCKALAGTPSDIAVIANSLTTTNAIINAYQCTFDGADYDASVIGANQLNLGSSVLVSNKVIGTVTYRAVVAAGTATFGSVPIFANNAAAIAGGVPVGGLYRSGGDPDILYIVH